MTDSLVDFDDLPYKLEDGVPLRQSVLWNLQHKYYAEQGAEAWRNGQVPHYATSNPTVANSYAEIILAFRRDYILQSQLLESNLSPITICELGAGSGRLAYHIISLLDQAGLDANHPTFRYVLTDFSESNLDAWRQQPKFQALFERGVLDLALLDVSNTERLELQASGKIIAAGSLETPLIVIANYLFDSIPQDLYYFDRGQTRRCMISLATNLDPKTTATSELVASLQAQYSVHPIPEILSEENAQQKILAEYRKNLSDTYLLFPSVALDCVERLKSFSKSGMLLLTADKGDHSLSDLQGQQQPALVKHGSFSYTVNYHAFAMFCTMNGGVALFPQGAKAGVSFGSLIMTDSADSYRETRSAYQRTVINAGPADFNTLARFLRHNMDEMTAEEVLSFIRLSHYDAHQLLRFLPRLADLTDSTSQATRSAAIEVIYKVWKMYLPLGETTDLANQIGRLLYELDEYKHALFFFSRSVELYGDNSITLYSMAACHYRLEEYEPAGTLLCIILQTDPEHEHAQELLDKCVAALTECRG